MRRCLVIVLGQMLPVLVMEVVLLWLMMVRLHRCGFHMIVDHTQMGFGLDVLRRHHNHVATVMMMMMSFVWLA